MEMPVITLPQAMSCKKVKDSDARTIYKSAEYLLNTISEKNIEVTPDSLCITKKLEIKIFLPGVKLAKGKTHTKNIETLKKVFPEQIWKSIQEEKNQSYPKA